MSPTEVELDTFLRSFEGVTVGRPFGDEVEAYRVGEEEKLFALIRIGSKPVRLSVLCDPQLATQLRETYETVLPGENLSKKNWNTIICSGQVSDEMIFDWIRLSYHLATDSPLLHPH